jgi:hypothetical protein
MFLPLHEIVKELETLQASIKRLVALLNQSSAPDDPRSKNDLYRPR